jgi:serine phosphatase RsbU (regulator of sigma subunit)
MVEPEKYKRLLFTLIKILIIVELVSAFLGGLNQHGWERFGIDLIIAGVLYVLWGRISGVILEGRESAVLKMRDFSDQITIWEALTFSLLSSDDIYKDIPADRRRLVVISYTLIALGLVAAFAKIGTGLMPLAVSGALILAAVNLVVWIASAERGERDTLQTELRLAQEVQLSLMPKTAPAIAGLEVAGLSVPAREVGGDLFDYSMPGGRTDGGRLGIAVVDVSGKGMQAAMAAVFASGAFASESQMSESPADILTRMNKTVFAHSKRGHFIAFLYSVIDTTKKQLVFSNAGQTKPLLRRDGKARWVETVGVHFPLGMTEESKYQEQHVDLQSGDILCFLTDGFTEAMNAQMEPYGTDRLEAILSESGLETYTAEQVVQFVTQHVRGHTGVAPQHDDMTIVVVKVA